MTDKQVISIDVEDKVREVARKLGFIDTPLISDGTHNIELSKKIKGKEEYFYIARITGIPRGELQIVICPQLDDEYANRLFELKSVRSAEKNSSKGKPVKSSQYPGFDNRLSGGEFIGWAWRLPINSDFSELRSFLGVFLPNLNEGVVSSIESIESEGYPEEISFPSWVHIEGAKKQIVVNAYERSVTARNKCIETYGAVCKACGFNFEKRYGEIGKGFIHIHHIVPLEEINEEYIVDPINDLIPLCPNCHSMAHKRKPPYSLLELMEIMFLNKNPSSKCESVEP